MFPASKILSRAAREVYFSRYPKYKGDLARRMENLRNYLLAAAVQQTHAKRQLKEQMPAYVY